LRRLLVGETVKVVPSMRYARRSSSDGGGKIDQGLTDSLGELRGKLQRQPLPRLTVGSGVVRERPFANPLVAGEQSAAVVEHLLDDGRQRRAAAQTLEREHPQGDQVGVHGRRREFQRVRREVLLGNELSQRLHGGGEFRLRQRRLGGHGRFLAFWQLWAKRQSHGANSVPEISLLRKKVKVSAIGLAPCG
jgi:hypothetical protein